MVSTINRRRRSGSARMALISRRLRLAIVSLPAVPFLLRPLSDEGGKRLVVFTDTASLARGVVAPLVTVPVVNLEWRQTILHKEKIAHHESEPTVTLAKRVDG